MINMDTSCSVSLDLPAETRLWNMVGYPWLVAPAATFAQNLIGGTEELEFDRPESWGMKFFASLSLLTSMGVPERMGAGTIDLGFEGGLVPSLSEEQRRIGFNGNQAREREPLALVWTGAEPYRSF